MIKYQNFQINRSHVWFSIQLFFVNPGIYFQLNKGNFDIIHTIGIRSFQSFIAALVSKQKKIPLVIADQGGLTTHPELKSGSLLKKFFIKLQSPFIRFIFLIRISGSARHQPWCYQLVIASIGI